MAAAEAVCASMSLEAIIRASLSRLVPLRHRVGTKCSKVGGAGRAQSRERCAPPVRARRLYRERGGTYAEAAREPGVDPGSLPDRVRRADAAQAPAGDNPFQMAEDLRRLRRESERLKRESEMLLKASAFFASRQL